MAWNPGYTPLHWRPAPHVQELPLSHLMWREYNRQREMDKGTDMPSIDIPADTLLKAICESIGYGRVMQLAAQLWKDKDGKRSLTVGPYATFMVPCDHPIKDNNGHCEVCCGVGQVTEWVSKHMRAGYTDKGE
jgi:hypothetical protein